MTSSCYYGQLVVTFVSAVRPNENPQTQKQKALKLIFLNVPRDGAKAEQDVAAVAAVMATKRFRNIIV